MKDAEVRHQFITLRAQFKSFDTISKELRVHKPTLIEWEHGSKEKIANLKAIELEELRERFWLTTKAQTTRGL